jgi:Zn-dependent alcohol dehydrogenase
MQRGSLKAAILDRPGQPMVIDEIALRKPRAH